MKIAGALFLVTLSFASMETIEHTAFGTLFLKQSSFR
jgi:hypothetical protein